MKTKKIEIIVSSLEDAGKRFIAAWHDAKKTQRQKSAREFITFKNFETLLKILTPKRLELLKFLRTQGPMSIRLLSKGLKRDYSNVHTDVKQLELCGLIEKNEADEVTVPWSEIIAHFPLVKINGKAPPPKKPLRPKYKLRISKS